MAANYPSTAIGNKSLISTWSQSIYEWRLFGKHVTLNDDFVSKSSHHNINESIKQHQRKT